MKLALAGNPNSGKTTMYNALTGRSEKVGNWAGVTVDRKEHLIKKSLIGSFGDIIAVDLPGAYSMSPYTSEESVTSEYIRGERPDVIVNIVDATNLARSLFLTTELLELGIPVVVALNKADVNEKRETVIDKKMLSRLLGCPVVETVSTSGKGLSELIKTAVLTVGKGQNAPFVKSDKAYRNKESAEEDDRRRYSFVNGVVEKVESRKVFSSDTTIVDKLDDILTGRWLGLPIFALVMFLVFWISQLGPGAWIAEGITIERASGDIVIPGLSALFDGLSELVEGAMASADADAFLTSVIVDGLIGGVGAVLGFLPLVMVMYFLISLLEDCGYMARATVVLDPIFKKVGLSGKSIIPFIVGTGCSVPGVMATRTIRDERERRATAMLAPFMPCGAKLPVIALFAGAFFGNSPIVGPLMYFAGIAIILLGAYIVNGITCYKGKRSYFVIELPDYKAPSVKRAAKEMLGRGWSYIVKAGTVILVCNFLIHLMQSFTWSLAPTADAGESILASVATPFAYIFAPIVGVVAWQLAAATIAGFVAKENVVGTLAVCFAGLNNFIDTDELAMIEGAGGSVAGIMAITKVAALAFLMLNLFSPPCFAAIGAMSAEMKSKKWLFSGIALQFGMGYSVGFLVYFFGTFFTGGSFGDVWMPILGWILVIGFAVTLAVLITVNQKKFKKEYETKRSAAKEASAV